MYISSLNHWLGLSILACVLCVVPGVVALVLALVGRRMRRSESVRTKRAADRLTECALRLSSGIVLTVLVSVVLVLVALLLGRAIFTGGRETIGRANVEICDMLRKQFIFGSQMVTAAAVKFTIPPFCIEQWELRVGHWQ